MMTETQLRTVELADSVLHAPAEHLAIETTQYPACFLELLDVLTDHLTAIREVGIGWRIIQLELLKGKIPKERLADVQRSLL